jgi:hypothetical protein
MPQMDVRQTLLDIKSMLQDDEDDKNQSSDHIFSATGDTEFWKGLTTIYPSSTKDSFSSEALMEMEKVEEDKELQMELAAME